MTADLEDIQLRRRNGRPMCGIAGMYNMQGNCVSAFELKRMCDVMSYRGPDDAGYVLINAIAPQPYWRELTDVDYSRRQPDFFFPAQGRPSDERDLFNVALGHRRLSIIDTSAMGHQPMPNRTRDVWIVYNGEVYNYLELREMLKERGHHFVSKSDTEVILHLYDEFGERCLDHLNGIFAFAIFDMRKRRLFIARDRYGVKPLYFAVNNGCLVFASEVKALFQVEGVKRALNPRALAEYFTFQNTLDDMTLFEGVRILRPGHFLMVDTDGLRGHLYWDFQFKQEPDKGQAYYEQELREILTMAVKRQMRSDVPVGAYLSGGIDTGAIVGIASGLVPRLKSFTIGFDMTKVTGLESYFDERADAEIMAARFGTEHYQMVMHAGDMEYALPRVIWHIEDLRVGMCYPGFYLSQLASKFVKVSLAGTGGDEVLAGYPWRYRSVMNCSSDEEFEDTYYKYWQRLISDDDKSAAFTPGFLKEIRDLSIRDRFRHMFRNFADRDYLKRALYFEAKTFLHGLLVIEDKLSMAHSLEARVPLLDNELVDFASRIPSRHLVNFSEGVPEQLAGKYIFRSVMRSHLPDRILNKPKQGFSAPEENWYKLHLLEYVRSVLFAKDSRIVEYIRADYINRILAEHNEGIKNHRLLIWSFLSFEWWCRAFLGDLYHSFTRHEWDAARNHRSPPLIPPPVSLTNVG